MEDLTYNSLIDSTPSSKKRHYHGVDYCFSNHDSSLDSKLTKIQQSYLVSEGAANCSNSCTPQAERVRREEARRKKRALQQEAREEEQRKKAKKEVGRLEDATGASARLEGEERPLDSREGVDKDPVSVALPGVTLTPRTKSRSLLKYRRLRGKASLKGQGRMSGGEGSEVGGAGVQGQGAMIARSKGSMVDGIKAWGKERPVGNQAGMGHCDKSVAVPGVMLTPRTKSRRLLKYRRLRGGKASWKGLERMTEGSGGRGAESEGATEDVGISEGATGDTDNQTCGPVNTAGAMEAEAPISSVAASEDSVVSETLQENNLIPNAGTTAKRSPRKAPRSRESSCEQTKENRRKLLGQAVVSALKRNGMSRSHEHFRTCFERLFKLSKIFLEVGVDFSHN